MKLGNIDYEKNTPPRGYRCTVCDVHGCKLWRQYQTMACYIELVCCDCAAADQDKDIADIDESGKYSSDYGRGDQIGSMIPAVPTQDGETYWGYTSVPPDGCDWWNKLPTCAAKTQENFTRLRNAFDWIKVRTPTPSGIKGTAGGLVWAFKHWQKANVKEIKFKWPWSYPQLGYRLQIGPKVIVGYGFFKLYWVVPGYEKEAEEM